MSKYLKRYIYLFKQLQKDDLDEDLRNEYEEEIEEVYYELSNEEIDYIQENELEM